MKFTIAILLNTLVCYLMVSFVLWEFDPGQWSTDSRAIISILWGILFLFSVMVFVDPITGKVT